MHYKFPHIEHLDQVKEAIKDNKAFLLAHKGQYSIVNYLYNSPEVFPEVTDTNSAILRECRGIAFDGVGRIISRPFHKFFNYGERVETIPKVLAKDVYLHDKLDGSMIRPLYLPDGFRLATKMGITDIALQAEDFIKDKPNYAKFINKCREEGLTPIFEWCSRLNRVVIDHPKASLTLLAIRETKSGQYLDIINALGAIHDIPRCGFEELDILKVSSGFAPLKSEKNKEGYVLVYPNGHRMKVKTNWYVELHRAKDAVSKEKHVIKAIIEGKIDDQLPLLDDDTKKAVEQFQTKFWEGLTDMYETLVLGYSDSRLDISNRKAFALSVKEHLQPKYHKYFFFMFDNKDLMHELQQDIVKHCSSGPRIDEIRWLFGDCKYEELTYEN